MPVPSQTTVLIASYLEPEHVDRVRRLGGRVRVVYAPELLRPPRYAADHKGGARERTPEQEARWRALLREADVLFDFDQTHLDDLPELAPRLRWIQATSAGIGQLVRRLGYPARIPGLVITTASGVHAQPLAEFCLLSMVAFSRGIFRMVRDQGRRHWERYAGSDLAGRTLVIVGMGRVGRAVARVSRGLGMRILGVRREVSEAVDPATLDLDELVGPRELATVLARADYLVLSAPHTPETEGMIGARELALLPQGAVLINIGRGALVDEEALIAALRSGHLGGASLDVFAEEPLPGESPLWDMPNVLVSPHSGSTSDRENERLTDLFCDNLTRFLAGEPLLNVLDADRLY